MTAADKSLTPKQEEFCQHYALTGDAYKAYKAAYNPASTSYSGIQANACNLLKKPHIVQRVQQLQDRTAKVADDVVRKHAAQEAARQIKTEEAEAAFDIAAEKVLQELAVIGFSNMADYVKMDEMGNPIVNFTNVTRRQFAAVAEITIEDIDTGPRKGKRTKFKLLDKRAALVDLGRHLGLFKDDRTVNVNVHADAATTFDSRLAALAARAVAEEVSKLPHGEGTSGAELSLELLGAPGTDRAQPN